MRRGKGRTRAARPRKKKKKRTNARGRGRPGGIPGRRELLIRVGGLPRWHCGAAAPAADRQQPPHDARVLRARPRRARRSDRRAAVAAASRARAVAPAGRARLGRGARPSRRGDKRRGGGESGRALELSRLDATTSRVGRSRGAGGGSGRGRGGGGPAAGNRTVAARTSARPRDRRFRGLASPERAFECAGRVRRGCRRRSERDDEIPTARSMASNKYRPTGRSEPITERLKPPIAV